MMKDPMGDVSGVIGITDQVAESGDSEDAHTEKTMDETRSQIGDIC